MANTEKPTTKNQQKKQGVVSAQKKVTPNSVSKVEVRTTSTPSKKLTKEVKSDKIKVDAKKEDFKESKMETKPSVNEKKPITKRNVPKVNKDYAVVNATSLPISTKYAVAICKFVKDKKIEKAIADLEEVVLKKKAVPMKGEIAHKKGKGMMSGKYPKKASENFIMLLKSLLANANANELEDSVVTEAIANLAQRPFGKQGRIRRKRTHVKLVAKSFAQHTSGHTTRVQEPAKAGKNLSRNANKLQNAGEKIN